MNGGARLLLLGGAVLLAGSVLDPAPVALDRAAWIGSMSAACAMVAAGLLEMWRGRK